MNLPGLNDYRYTAFGSIPGWMHNLDLELFDRILAHQIDADIHGDLLEIGSYHGKSAIVLGYAVREDEALTVCDLFGTDAEGVSAEGMDAYEGLTVSAFEAQYGKFHQRRPLIHAGPSSTLNLTGCEFRFAHIDGGHAYDTVRDDISLVQPHALNGVVTLDDYRSAHTPGVSAATWEATAHGILFPFLLSEVKMYAATTQEGQQYWLDVCRQFDLPREEHAIHGYDVARMWLP